MGYSIRFSWGGNLDYLQKSFTTQLQVFKYNFLVPLGIKEVVVAVRNYK